MNRFIPGLWFCLALPLWLALFVSSARGQVTKQTPETAGSVPEVPDPAAEDAAPGVWDEAPEEVVPAATTTDVETGRPEGVGAGRTAEAGRPASDLELAVQEEMTPKELDIWRMARLLDIPYPLLKQGVEAFEDVYARRYDQARKTFEALSLEYPEAALGPFGMAVLAQAQMAENLDYSQDQAYQSALAVVLDRIDAALDRDQSPAWNYFMRGTVLGLNSFYNYRQDKVLGAIKDGWIAISDMERARKLTPAFVDPILGLGMYNYWRSVVTVWFKNLPGFPDRRQEGLEQMIYARDHGVFAPPLARLALAFSFYENHRFDDALEQSLALYEAYPDNIINLQVLGRVYMRKRKYRKAEKILLQVLEIDPANVQVHYALGYLYFYRIRDLERARTSLAIVAESKPGTYYGEMSRVRLGDVCWLLGEHDRALALWQTAYDALPRLMAAELRVKKDWRPPERPWRRQIAAAKRTDQPPQVRKKRSPDARPPSSEGGTPGGTGSAQPAGSQAAGEKRSVGGP